MLQFSKEQMRQLCTDRFQNLSCQIDAWLQKHLVDWSRRSPEERSRVMDEIIRLAERSGMKFETDYALFSRILLKAPEGCDAFIAREDVSRLLNNADILSAGKLCRLLELSGQGPATKGV